MEMLSSSSLTGRHKSTVNASSSVLLKYFAECRVSLCARGAVRQHDSHDCAAGHSSEPPLRVFVHGRGRVRGGSHTTFVSRRLVCDTQHCALLTARGEPQSRVLATPSDILDRRSLTHVAQATQNLSEVEACRCSLVCVLCAQCSARLEPPWNHPIPW